MDRWIAARPVGAHGLRLLKILGLIVVTMGSSACSRSIRYTVETDSRLNWYNDRPHSLELGLYQFRNQKDFDLAGSWKDLISGSFDATRIVGDPVIESALYPGTQFEKKIRKEKEARYLGVVAGYFNPSGDPPRTYAVFEIPGGLFRPRLEIRLGPNEIQEITKVGLLGRRKALLPEAPRLTAEVPGKPQYQELRPEVQGQAVREAQDKTPTIPEPEDGIRSRPVDLRSLGSPGLEETQKTK